MIVHEISSIFSYVRRTLLTLKLTYGNKKSIPVTFKVEGRVISFFIGRGGVACRGGTFQCCKFGNFHKGCILAILCSEDVL